MNNLVNETNARIEGIIKNLETIKDEYEKKLKKHNAEIEKELAKVKQYKEDFFTSKAKIEKMNTDIDGFEEDYKKLVERFKDDELANILIAANKEISGKIDERKRKIIKDKEAMNDLVKKAEDVKTRLVKLTAEKKALEYCLDRIYDSYAYYSDRLSEVITFAKDNKDYLGVYFGNDASVAPGIKESELDLEGIDMSDLEISLDDIEENSKEMETDDIDLNVTEELEKELDLNDEDLAAEIENIANDLEDDLITSEDLSDLVIDLNSVDENEEIELEEIKEEETKKKNTKKKSTKKKPVKEEKNELDDSLEDDDDLYE